MEAFEDKDYGQCKETFTEGPDYWIRIPTLRAKWKGMNSEQTKAVMDSLTKLGYDKDRDPN